MGNAGGRWMRYWDPGFENLPPEATEDWNQIPVRDRREHYELPPRCKDMVLALAWTYRRPDRATTAKPARPPRTRPSATKDKMKVKKLPSTDKEQREEIQKRFGEVKNRPTEPPIVTERDSLPDPKPEFTPEEIRKRFTR